ncbi:energy transducer TonB [Sphingomonas sp. HITSZ_GF]|uniref:energy transducer TonB family protein n=1 Tax=Sphingomonas sp. HITSZ_GF TaxID=3037247 RepID=UPI00240D727E|nr:energy transducer TonB [Sphingomonas sp. HITSZ_GF]MDG2535918.1 energy transducer TonB [Sphingomonas sp. HITSZ_GF]
MARDRLCAVLLAGALECGLLLSVLSFEMKQGEQKPARGLHLFDVEAANPASPEAAPPTDQPDDPQQQPASSPRPPLVETVSVNQRLSPMQIQLEEPAAAVELPLPASVFDKGEAKAVSSSSAPASGAPARQAAGSPQPAAADPDISNAYARRIVAWLEARKSFPADLARRSNGGLVIVRFSLDPRGQLIMSAIAQPSGSAWLDQLALDQVRRAAPFPRPPASLPASARVFEVPLRYRS